MSRAHLTAIRAADVAGTAITSLDLSADRVRQIVIGILENNVLCSIATVASDGHPHINTAYFSYSENFDLYLLSHPRSIHCRNLAINPSMSMTIFSTAQRWTDPGRGLQLFGTCAEAAESSTMDAERSYGGRFPAYAPWKASLKNEDLARQYRLYRFLVATLKIHDEKNLGDAVFVSAAITRD